MSTHIWRSQENRFEHGRSSLLLGFASFVILLVLVAVPAAAQQITGSITGTVRDEQGAVVTNTVVKSTNAETGFERSAVTDSTGAYNIQYLPVGRYTVEVDATGFKKFVQQNLVITVDTTHGKIMSGPDLVTRGFTESMSDELMNEARQVLKRVLEDVAYDKGTDWNSVKESMRKCLQKFYSQKSNRRPMILPVIMEM